MDFSRSAKFPKILGNNLAWSLESIPIDLDCIVFDRRAKQYLISYSWLEMSINFVLQLFVDVLPKFTLEILDRQVSCISDVNALKIISILQMKVLADTMCEFTKAMDMELDCTPLLGNVRSKR